MIASGKASLGVTPPRELNPAGCMKSQMNVCEGYSPLPSSPFMLIMIIPPLVLMEHLSQLFLGPAPLCTELEQLSLSTNLKTKRKQHRVRRLAPCPLHTAWT